MTAQTTMFEADLNRLDSMSRKIMLNELAEWISNLASEDSLLVIEYKTLSRVTARIRALTVRKHRGWRDHELPAAEIHGAAYYRGGYTSYGSSDYLKIVVLTNEARENAVDLVNDLGYIIDIMNDETSGWGDAFEIASNLLQLFVDVSYPYSTRGNRTYVFDTGGDYQEYEVKMVYYA